ncbi:hypothetical protein VNPA142037_28670 [Pseudomonas aeruginosa]|nr:hypothetical protein VNPA120840_54120 [Pseudomonas aeruginosa]GLF05337.1 hypothetical protein VNPA120889_54940 [Pseudomonas aeruginosa]GLF45720.1 hypothetical protein VNPA141752_23740 [Pseudomonas aeruginosa]GLF65075.1 hypothetical protein VNPA142037_28670 [Pseudomonas aeruginosa]HBO7095164.1 hypothetical protein [Pseudomonas aeruginosa]
MKLTGKVRPNRPWSEATKVAASAADCSYFRAAEETALDSINPEFAMNEVSSAVVDRFDLLPSMATSDRENKSS